MLIFAPTLGWSLASNLMPANAIIALFTLVYCIVVRQTLGKLQIELYKRRKGIAIDDSNSKNTAQPFDPARSNVQGQAVTQVAEHNGETQV